VFVTPKIHLSHSLKSRIRKGFNKFFSTRPLPCRTEALTLALAVEAEAVAMGVEDIQMGTIILTVIILAVMTILAAIPTGMTTRGFKCIRGMFRLCALECAQAPPILLAPHIL
jgi:hypothetical protein